MRPDRHTNVCPPSHKLVPPTATKQKVLPENKPHQPPSTNASVPPTATKQKVLPENKPHQPPSTNASPPPAHPLNTTRHDTTRHDMNLPPCTQPLHPHVEAHGQTCPPTVVVAPAASRFRARGVGADGGTPERCRHGWHAGRLRAGELPRPSDHPWRLHGGWPSTHRHRHRHRHTWVGEGTIQPTNSNEVHRGRWQTGTKRQGNTTNDCKEWRGGWRSIDHELGEVCCHVTVLGALHAVGGRAYRLLVPTHPVPRWLRRSRTVWAWHRATSTASQRGTPTRQRQSDMENPSDESGDMLCMHMQGRDIHA